MTKLINNVFILCACWLLVPISCSKKTAEKTDLDKIRTSDNRKSYPIAKMDSAKAIQFITRQKIQELLDLSALYTSGNRDTEIDSVIYAQMKNYFEKPDSAKLAPLLKQLDSLKAKTAKAGEPEVSKFIKGRDTQDIAKFSVEYFDGNNRSLGVYQKDARYVLKPAPVKFQKEFKFYFVNFGDRSPRDSTSSGKTR